MTNFESLDELTQTVILYRDLYQMISGSMARLKEYELLIKNAIKAGEDIPDVENVTITVTHPKNARVRWDTKALEGVVAIYPELKSLKTETWPAPSVRIRVET